MRVFGPQATAFGVVGNGNIHFVAAFQQLGGRYVSLRHEAGAVAAADAHYRATGRVAIASTTYGPGFTNALTALSEAQAARVPLVYVMGDIPTTGRRPIDVDQESIVAALGVRIIPAGTDPGRALAQAVRVARAEFAPVIVSVPHDQVLAPCDAVATENFADAPAPHIPTELPELAEILVSARRPLVLAGRGVVESGTAGYARELVDLLGGLGATSALASGVFEPQWNLGIAGGFAHRGRLATFAAADVVLVLGASLNKLQARVGTLLHPEARVIRLSDAPHPATFLQVEQINCQLSDALPALVAAVRECEPAGPGWREELGQLPVAEQEELDPGCFAETCADGRLDPRHALRRLNELLPQQRTVVTDGGHFLGWVPKYLEVPESRALVMVGSAVMTIGLGYASAVGAGVGAADRTTVMVGGDGGMLMGLADAESFYRAVDRSITLILNDAAYGAEVHQYTKDGVDPSTMHVPEVDYATLSAGFGVPGLSVSSPEQLQPGGEVERFLAQHPRCLLDVKISREPVADFLREG